MNKEFRCGDVILNLKNRSGYPTSIYHGCQYEEPTFIQKGELMLVIEIGDGLPETDDQEMLVITDKGVMWTVIFHSDTVTIEHTNI